jgi:exodeoxyribonuclease I
VALPDDVLPNPDAALVTGITPQHTRAKGISEWRALRLINEQFSVPHTCVAGYNSLRFDDEFVRHGCTAISWTPTLGSGVTATHAGTSSTWFEPPARCAVKASSGRSTTPGLPVYKLERLTEANGIDHGRAHDALADVRATVALARLIRDRQPAVRLLPGLP